MAQRLELQALLEQLLGSRNVYFQPPASVNMQYPAIVYNRDGIDTEYADDKPYSRKKRYQVTVIDRSPDSNIHEKVGALSTASYDRFFTADNLNHDVYTLFF